MRKALVADVGIEPPLKVMSLICDHHIASAILVEVPRVELGFVNYQFTVLTVILYLNLIFVFYFYVTL